MSSPLLIRLEPLGPFRFGLPSGARDQTDIVFHSDSLYSSLCAAMDQLGRLSDWLGATASEASIPAVRLSSCFPAVQDLLFVPPPRTLWPPAAGRVRWKSARLVPLSAVQALARAETLSDERWTVDARSGCLLPIERNVAFLPPFRMALRSAAAVDRATCAATQPHMTACLEFAEGAGLWCHARFSDDESRERWKEPLQTAFRLLGDSGIGGERSRGWGRFRPGFADEDPFSAFARESGNWWLLSLFSPRADDMVSWDRGDYTLVERSGRVGNSGLATRALRMVEEGSVLTSAAAPIGSARDVAPDGIPHPVYRAGFAIAIPLAGGGPA